MPGLVPFADWHDCCRRLCSLFSSPGSALEVFRRNRKKARNIVVSLVLAVAALMTAAALQQKATSDLLKMETFLFYKPKNSSKPYIHSLEAVNGVDVVWGQACVWVFVYRASCGRLNGTDSPHTRTQQHKPKQ